MERWSSEGIEYWNDGILEDWNNGVVDQSEPQLQL
jgi:hypothetical protein